MTDGRRRWLGDGLTMRSFLKPHRVAKAVFHPAWVPEPVDSTVESLKRVRIICGTIAALGVYTFVEGGFAFDEMLRNMLTACLVLLLITPLSIGVMLYVWRRTGTVRQLRAPLVKSLILLLLFIGSVLLLMTMVSMGTAGTLLPPLLSAVVGLWLTWFVGAGAVHVCGNFFGTAGVHRCLPPLLASVTTWLMAIPDLLTGDLHGLSLTLGIVFILGAPMTVTGIALLEMNRLRRRYGIRLGAHPATLPPPLPPHGPVPLSGNPFGNPYAPGPVPPGQGSPYAG
ncbi:hypothetical protein BIV24_20960 [Streptomyces colonosanans]|uniref:Uncharacterized protein n=1 Tax=Streptomyces colonosanans TaxID=1428652 RepID=A0A1S2P824_9ACTN|nr:hypothetical protein BIV24_20960 [Streptomyces colonosanans]